MLVQEKVGKGHPDKICDFIAEEVKEFLISLHSEARTAIEVCAYKIEKNKIWYSKIIIFGEYWLPKLILKKHSRNLEKDIKKYLVKKLKKHLTIDYFNYLNMMFELNLSQQSKEIYEKSKMGAGDQGIIAHHYNKKIEKLFSLTEKAKKEIDNLKSIGKDWKMLIDSSSKKIILNFHFPNYLKENYNPLQQTQILKSILDSYWKDYSVKINHYSQGSIISDSGLSGRKIFCDFPFGYVWGGGAVWGKDASKVDNSALLYSREFAKCLAKLKKAKHIKVTLIYNIGLHLPTNCEILIDDCLIDSKPYLPLFSTENLNYIIRNKKFSEIQSQVKKVYLKTN